MAKGTQINDYLLTARLTGIKPILGIFDGVEQAKAYVIATDIIWSRPDTLTGAIHATNREGYYAGYTIELVERNPVRKR